MASDPSELPLESWLDTALAGAQLEEVFDDDGTFAGWWAEHPDFPGASASGATRDEAGQRLRDVLAGWVTLGQELGHPIPSIRKGEIATPA
ncbi:MAG: type II toxin-antitoxin system HicB family antitoxin [Acidimicrobiaceae bacterium]|nr:type II toxin-antitoxin system HicB family antitoxin [Acidimicrobiaceae bacterium]MCY3608072.1 type II toxin-antitoxin system HicB family antitoxin [Acidimicrobiaceae bacterium]MDE0678317.1 type II toxin-antitoxin system HicB family antitoxin [Acidimicrobiaceae bacterium]